MDPSGSLAKLSEQLSQWNSRSQRPRPSAHAASLLGPAAAPMSSALTREGVGTLQNGLRQWSSGWEQTLKRLRHVAAPPSPVAESALLLPEPPAALKAKPAGANSTLREDGFDENRLKLADIKKALAHRNEADATPEEQAAPELGQCANGKMHWQQLLLHDIAETGRVAELQLQHKKATADLEHRLRAEIAEFKSQSQLAKQTAELQESETERQREKFVELQEQHTRRGFELRRLESRASTLEMELEEQERVAAERLEAARAALAAEKQRAKALALEEKEERVSLIEHQHLQGTCKTLDANIASFRAQLAETHKRMSEVAARNHELQKEKERVELERDEAAQSAEKRSAERDFFEEKFKESSTRESKLRLDVSVFSSRLESMEAELAQSRERFSQLVESTAAAARNASESASATGTADTKLAEELIRLKSELRAAKAERDAAQRGRDATIADAETRAANLQRQVETLQAKASVELIATERLRHELNELQHNSTVQHQIGDSLSKEREMWVEKFRGMTTIHRTELGERDTKIFELEHERSALQRTVTELQRECDAKLAKATQTARIDAQTHEKALRQVRAELAAKTQACRQLFEQAEKQMLIQRQQIVHLRQRWIANRTNAVAPNFAEAHSDFASGGSGQTMGIMPGEDIAATTQPNVKVGDLGVDTSTTSSAVMNSKFSPTNKSPSPHRKQRQSSGGAGGATSPRARRALDAPGTVLSPNRGAGNASDGTGDVVAAQNTPLHASASEFLRRELVKLKLEGFLDTTTDVFSLAAEYLRLFTADDVKWIFGQPITCDCLLTLRRIFSSRPDRILERVRTLQAILKQYNISRDRLQHRWWVAALQNPDVVESCEKMRRWASTEPWCANAEECRYYVNVSQVSRPGSENWQLLDSEI